MYGIVTDIFIHWPGICDIHLALNTGSHDPCVQVLSRAAVITIIRTMNTLYITFS